MNHQPRYRRTKRSGATLLEVSVAATMSVAVLFGAIMALVTGLETWARGEGRIGANSSAQMAMRTISTELRQAMEVTELSDVNDTDGHIQRISYKLPTRLSDGTFISPPVWDNVTRRIEYVRPRSHAETGRGFIRIVSINGAARRERVIADGVTLTDPLTGEETRVFEIGEGQMARSILVTISTDHIATGDENATTRVSENIYLRNIPVVTN